MPRIEPTSEPIIEPILAWNLGPDYPRWTEVLRDQTSVLIRPIGKQDIEHERTFIEALSPRSRRFRFLGQVREPSSELLRQLTDIDYSQDVAFAAVLADGSEETFLGISRYSTSRDGASCEFAITVHDEWHYKGLGTILMRHLIEVARARGIREMISIDSAANVEMAEFAKFLGFTTCIDPEDRTQVLHTLRLQPLA